MSGHHSNGGLGRSGFFEPPNAKPFTRTTGLSGQAIWRRAWCH